MDATQTMHALPRYIDALIARSDAQHPAWNIERVRSGQPNKWNYIDGCMMLAVLTLFKHTGEPKYLRFADDFLGAYIDEDGRIPTYDMEEWNLDNIQPGRAALVLYDLTGKPKYRKALDVLRKQLALMPKTDAGSFWHKQIYPHQVWLDGLYMAQPFLLEYETRFNRMEGCFDSFKQFLTVRKHMRDGRTGLYYHGYDASGQMYWANPQTGCSPNFWLRALGWFALALCDSALLLDEQLYYERRTLGDMLKELIDALAPFQHGGGMFYQVVDQPTAPGNYLESSGTLLIACAILRAVRSGLLPARYAAMGERAFFGTAQRYLHIGENGEPVLGGTCLVAGLGGAQNRDGSLAYYFSEPIVENEAKGVAPLLMAYVELLLSREKEKIHA